MQPSINPAITQQTDQQLQASCNVHVPSGEPHDLGCGCHAAMQVLQKEPDVLSHMGGESGIEDSAEYGELSTKCVCVRVMVCVRMHDDAHGVEGHVLSHARARWVNG